MASMVAHRFFCMNCGAENLPVWRKASYKHEKHHRKALYCPKCRCEVNHIECRTDEEANEFRIAFENGEYKEEAAESIAYIKNKNNIWG